MGTIIEVSYLISVQPRPEAVKLARKTVLSLAKLYKQESILEVDSAREASLVFGTDSSYTYLGRFERVSAAEAHTYDGYTMDGNDYWVAKG